MDIREKYIEMCKAEEIQSKWRPRFGDFYVYLKHPNASSLQIFQDSIFIDNDTISTEYWIWLPRQDQLQDILSDAVTVGYMISGLDAFYDPESQCGYDDPPCRKCQNLGTRRRLTYDTMEQWWLAFLMYERFNKEWCSETSEWCEVE